MGKTAPVTPFVIPIKFPAFPSQVKQIVKGDKIVGSYWTPQDGNRMIYQDSRGNTYIGDKTKPVLPSRYSIPVMQKNRMWF